MKALSIAVVLLVSTLVALAQTGSVSGIVHDELGAPLPGAHVAMSTERFALPPRTTSTDERGQYRFGPVAAGAYQVEVSLSGFLTQSQTITVSNTPLDAMTVTLKRQPAESGPRPRFEAAGVRGLIDPGGYSAPANAAAASGLIKGIADIKRTENGAASSASCNLEPALQKAVADQPQNGGANLRLGQFYLAHGQTAKAIPLLQRARSLNPDDRATLQQLAQGYLQAQQFEPAKQLLLSQAQPTPEENRLLARANEGLGKFSEAAEDYRRAALQHASEESLFGVGYEDILAGSPKEAATAFADGVTRYPQSMQLLIGLGSAQFLLGHAEEAIQTLLRAVALDPGDPRPYPSLSQASSITSDAASRVHGVFEHYANAAPQDPRSSYYLALNMLHDSAADDARIEQLLQHSIALDPGLADAHYQLGVLSARRGDYQRAAKELETTIRLSPTRREAHYRLAVAYRQLGQQESSAKEMQRFHEMQEPEATKGVSIDQYISVLATPTNQGACPADTPAP